MRFFFLKVLIASSLVNLLLAMSAAAQTQAPINRSAADRAITDIPTHNARSLPGFDCGRHAVPYRRINEDRPVENSIYCMRFYPHKPDPRSGYSGFMWYTERVIEGRHTIGIGRYTKASGYVAASVPSNAAQFNSTHSLIVDFEKSARSFPDEIRFSQPPNYPSQRRWEFRREDKKPSDYHAPIKPFQSCGKGLMRFMVFAIDDTRFADNTGYRCVSKDQLIWYGGGSWGEKEYRHVGTVVGRSNKWGQLLTVRGLRAEAVDICNNMDYCGRAVVRLKKICVRLATHETPAIKVSGWNEIWLPSPEPNGVNRRHMYELGSCS